MIWTDNMIIPKGAENKYTAELMMDWVYDVDRAARLANFIYYISPGQGRRRGDHRARPGGGAATRCCSRPADVVAKQHPQPNWDEADRGQGQRAVRRPDRRLAAADREPTRCARDRS